MDTQMTAMYNNFLLQHNLPSDSSFDTKVIRSLPGTCNHFNSEAGNWPINGQSNPGINQPQQILSL